MNYIEALKKEEILTTTTENGDTAFQTTGHFALIFMLAGGMRYNYKDLNNLFIRSYYENKLITLRSCYIFVIF